MSQASGLKKTNCKIMHHKKTIIFQHIIILRDNLYQLQKHIIGPVYKYKVYINNFPFNHYQIFNLFLFDKKRILLFILLFSQKNSYKSAKHSFSHTKFKIYSIISLGSNVVIYINFIQNSTKCKTYFKLCSYPFEKKKIPKTEKKYKKKRPSKQSSPIL